ncbi:hypothetical protein [Xylanimonas protaetiae]|uniref:Uncharacterized protein n=1 Tax=Xylanimonas protaetiae TaxID=2509457 RepID=A0A4V0YG53_9MICO|nr:hypothetical protein [Xylanimonas protaetiae]QAY70011.1 hypothetical protein ET471_08175 [Xylanimonas protaetiae]
MPAPESITDPDEIDTLPPGSIILIRRPDGLDRVFRLDGADWVGLSEWGHWQPLDRDWLVWPTWLIWHPDYATGEGARDAH